MLKNFAIEIALAVPAAMVWEVSAVLGAICVFALVAYTFKLRMAQAD